MDKADWYNFIASGILFSIIAVFAIYYEQWAGVSGSFLCWMIVFSLFYRSSKVKKQIRMSGNHK